MRNWRNNKRIFITLWKLLEAALTVIQLAKMIYESPFGEWIRKVLTFLT